MIYKINEAIIGFPANTLLERATFEIKNKEKIAIVGRNGCGKTTLLKVIAGTHETDNPSSDEGHYIYREGSVRIGYLEQISFANEHNTVREELLKVYGEIFECQDRLKEITKRLERESDDRILSEYARVSEQFEKLGGYTYKSEMEQIFTRFGFDIADLERPIDTFSGGQKTKVAFVSLLLSKPDILLLDEPTNHLDLPTIEWLESYLRGYSRAVVIVSHDRMFLDRITDITYEIEHKQLKRYTGNYTAFLKQKQEDYEKQCKAYEAQQKEIARLTEFIEKWKNTPTKVSMTHSKKMQIEHMVKIPKPLRFDTRSIHNKFQPSKTSGVEVLCVNKLGIGYTSELAEVSFTLRRGQRLAILGENGRGKSTLLKTLVGQIAAFGGNADINSRVHFGTEVDWAYFDQELLNLDESKTVIDEFWDTYPRLDTTEVRTILGNFLFSGDDVYQQLSQLSGGEKVRLSLAKLMKRQANLLILDEPTNHLDMIGKNALEGILKDYEGTLLFVSHDRYFVRAVADCLLVFENGEVNYYPYDYETYLEKRALNGADMQKTDIRLRVARVVPVNRQKNGKHDEAVKASSPDGKKTDYKPDRAEQKERQRRERKLANLETAITEQEAVIEELRCQYAEPEIAADYEKLSLIEEKIKAEEKKLDELMEAWEELAEQSADGGNTCGNGL